MASAARIARAGPSKVLVTQAGGMGGGAHSGLDAIACRLNLTVHSGTSGSER
jgi:hypothetical protein